jgi:hypothetical protein
MWIPGASREPSSLSEDTAKPPTGRISHRLYYSPGTATTLTGHVNQNLLLGPSSGDAAGENKLYSLFALLGAMRELRRGIDRRKVSRAP